MNERDSFERLVERYGPVRARHLLGALRVLTLYDERELLRRERHLAGVPWPSPGDERGPMPQGER